MSDNIIETAIERGLFDDAPWALFIDIDRLQHRFALLNDAFPADTLHAVAVKANPLVSLLRQLVDQGAGLEAASFGEIEVARLAGADDHRIVYDSPAKTVEELQRALHAGIYINADNLSELQRIDGLNPPEDARVGIRINPVIGAGDIEATSVATKASKFGVSLTRNRRALLEAFRRYDWLRGLHVHTGSQGLELDALVEGVKRCIDFADDIDADPAAAPVETIDIGGGLPVAYHPHDETPGVDQYATALRDEIPHLFSGPRNLITEFGRWLFAPCGLAVSRVEYVKESPAGPIATIHFGADLLLRTAYRPDDWYHRVTIHDGDGRRRSGDETQLTIAGPLCFSGDLVARRRPLPRPQPGDFAAVHDTGGYTFSMWSRYCSRAFPRVFGVRKTAAEALTFQPLHPGE